MIGGPENTSFRNAPQIDFLGIPYLLGDAPGSQDRKSCRATLYESEPVRLLFGEALHPGGLALTHRLGKLADIKCGQLVVDVASGRGASSVAVARSFHCRVVGVDLSQDGVAGGTRRASEDGLDGQVSFIRGDGESLPLAGSSFDSALCECSMSLFPDKWQGVAEIARLLRTGGRLGVSDVTVEPGCLPDELKGTAGQMLCLADAPYVDGYQELLSGDGLTLLHRQDASDSITRLLADVEGKLGAFRMLQALGGGAPANPDLISQALDIIEKVKSLVKEGGIGYWLFVSEKTAT